MPVVITEPGIYDGLPEAEYHAHDSLSSTGARKMLPPSCPALFEYERTHPVHKDVFDFGSAAHGLVLGIGPKVEIVDARDWTTKEAKERKKAAYANGFIPLLAHEWARVEAMAAAIQDHPIAGVLFDPLDGGRSEQSIFWQDPDTGVMCRCRPDRITGQRDRFGRLVVVDYKSSAHADLESIPKSVANFGYAQQDAWYVDGIRAAGLDGDPQFLFAFQEKTAPYLITVVQLDPESQQIGRERNRVAIERYRDCRVSGIWPPYTNDIELITLPPWARSRGDDLL